mmetsp:Transcript_19082/g.55483  ORF Transcript_19082/g.55483 Transcript_19082/m.55483 type:complete len:231 (-) Transcript_19082:320-1012(-)
MVYCAEVAGHKEFLLRAVVCHGRDRYRPPHDTSRTSFEVWHMPRALGLVPVHNAGRKILRTESRESATDEEDLIMRVPGQRRDGHLAITAATKRSCRQGKPSFLSSNVASDVIDKDKVTTIPNPGVERATDEEIASIAEHQSSNRCCWATLGRTQALPHLLQRLPIPATNTAELRLASLAVRVEGPDHVEHVCRAAIWVRRIRRVHSHVVDHSRRRTVDKQARLVLRTPI